MPGGEVKVPWARWMPGGSRLSGLALSAALAEHSDPMTQWETGQ
ncbi:hypothetical protein OA50_04223 [Mameliella alba]|uniref:Uncharacterized protein n=1 Tax=Mameliella alba TaxID=561184 RepID=A0A0B3RT40_9RHOB|nr:hypothetical protein OA50_04223 [Mameliella alba]